MKTYELTDMEKAEIESEAEMEGYPLTYAIDESAKAAQKRLLEWQLQPCTEHKKMIVIAALTGKSQHKECAECMRDILKDFGIEDK